DSIGGYNQGAFVARNGKPENVIHAGFASKESGLHPTQKPISLMKTLIELTTQEGQLVIDPFSGSGSTLVAAKELGRSYIGFELNPAYVEISKKRLKDK
ncbi:site-specific DNA-methyltransferase, partial [Leptospira borgpetersenii serovar Ballum]|uniref:DNA-methyltransferase n=1 Tax=Leptospira borgpetersenii TaxID=174 RepID=UPI0018806BB5